MKKPEKFDYLIVGYQKGKVVYKAKIQASLDLKEAVANLAQVCNGSKNEEGQFILWTYRLLNN